MKRPWNLLALTVLVWCASLPTALSHSSVHAGLSAGKWTAAVQATVRIRLAQLETPFTYRSNRKVLRHVRSFLVEGRRATERTLERARQYFPIFEHYLQLYDLPPELKYVPMVESRLQPRAESAAGAAGLWQFMPATAAAYGLEINEWRDDRLDPDRASEAAVRLLADLYARFGHWSLALAAYNCGPHRVQLAIERAGGKSMEDVWLFLPRQTQRYLHRLCAAYYVGEFGRLHGLQILPDVTEPPAIRLVRVDRSLSFRQIAAATGMSKKEIARWNPALQQAFVAGGKEGYQLRMPAGKAAVLRSYLGRKDHFPPFAAAGQMRLSYTVAGGDRIEELACLFDCSVEEILYWNDLRRPVLAVNQQLELRPPPSFWLRVV